LLYVIARRPGAPTTSGAADLTKIATRMALLTFVHVQELRLAKWKEVDVEACVARDDHRDFRFGLKAHR
jgi:hypothetical protein